MGRCVNAAAALGVSGKLLWFACPRGRNRLLMTQASARGSIRAER